MPAALGVDVFTNPGFFVTYAAIQAVLLLVLVRLMDPFERLSLGLLALLALWGATGAAFIALVGNEAIKGLLDPEAREVFGDAVSAPLVEEVAKGAALLAVLAASMWLTKRSGALALSGVSAWMACGAAVGLGFSFTEDFFYFIDRTTQEGVQAGADFFLGRRNFFGPTALHHPLFTAAFGAGVGLATWSRSLWGKLGFPLLGLAVAILMHAVNNGLVELIIVIRHGLDAATAWVQGTAVAPEVEDTADISSAALVVLDYVWIIAFLAAIAFWQRYQRRAIRAQLMPEVEGGVVDREDVELICTGLARPRLYWRQLRSGRLDRLRRARALHNEQARLGLLKWQTERFGGERRTVLEQRRRVIACSSIEAGGGTLPRPVGRLFGREGELRELRELLEEARIVTLTGPGGSGKTRLATEAAELTEDDFAGGAYFVDLSPLDDPGQVPAAIAAELGLGETPGERRLELLCEQLRDRALLLVLDNFEQVAAAAPEVAAIAAAAPRVRTIVTSRVALDVAGERVLEVPPLATEAVGGAESPAVALFGERARAAAPAFEPSDADREAIAGICERLDGLPLAIELAAARTSTLSPGAILMRLDSRAELPGAVRPDLPARQRNLEATVSWSEDLLDQTSRTLLRRISVYPVGCRIEAAAAIFGDAADKGVLEGLLLGLRRASLLTQRPDPDGEPRFRMLETIRGLALSRLEESGEGESTRAAAARHLRALAAELGPLLGGASQEEATARLDPEYENLRAALEWLDEEGELEAAVGLAVDVAPLWERGHVTEADAWLTPVLARRAGGLSPGARARALRLGGRLSLLSSDYAVAERRLRAALEQEVLPEEEQLRARWDAGWADLFRGRYEDAERGFREALELSRALGRPADVGQSQANLGRALAEQGRLGEARGLLRESERVRREAGDLRGTASSLSALGRLELIASAQEEAGRRLEEALAIARRIGDELRIAEALFPLSLLALDRGDTARAGELSRERLQRCLRLGDTLGAAESLEVLASCAEPIDPERATETLGAASGLREAIGAMAWRSDRDRNEALSARLAEALGRERFEAAWGRGRAMTEAEAVAAATAPATPAASG